MLYAAVYMNYAVNNVDMLLVQFVTPNNVKCKFTTLQAVSRKKEPGYEVGVGPDGVTSV